MTSKHRLTCIAISAAVALKLFAGTANAASRSGETDARQGRVLLTVLHDAQWLDWAADHRHRYFESHPARAARQGSGHRPGRRRASSTAR